MGTSSSSTHDSSRAWVVNNTQKEVMWSSGREI